jgi:hypothetical protein
MLWEFVPPLLVLKETEDWLFGINPIEGNGDFSQQVLDCRLSLQICVHKISLNEYTVYICIVIHVCICLYTISVEHIHIDI